MTVPTSDNREEYTGNDVTTSFDYAFKIFEDSDLQVYLQAADGTETLLVLNTDYSVSGAGDLVGGSVTYPLSGDPLASDEKLIILRVLEVVQETDLRNQGAYYPQVIEDELDRSRMIDQQQQEEINRALKRPAAEDGYDADGRQIKNGAAATDGSDFVIKSQVDNRFSNDVITKTAGNWDAKGLRLLALQTSDTPQSDEAVNRQHMEAYFNSVVLGGGPYANLRSELISPDAGKGSDLVAHTGTSDTVTEALGKRTIYVGSVADMVSAPLAVGSRVSTLGYYSAGDGGGNEYEIVAGATGTADGGSFIDLSNGNQARGLFASSVYFKQFGAVGDGVTPDGSAVSSALATGMDCDGGGITNVYLLESSVAVSDSQTVTNFHFKKGANGPVISNLPESASLKFGKISGNSASFTGTGCNITSGNTQNIIEVDIVDTESYPVDVQGSFAQKAIFRGGVWSSATAGTESIKFSDTGFSNGDINLEAIYCSGQPLAYLGARQNIQIIGCNTTGVTFTANCAKVSITGSRLALLGGTMTVLGNDHVVVGNTVAGDIELGSGATQCEVGPNAQAGSVIDNSGLKTNNIVERKSIVRGWVNFDGTVATPSIRGSYGVDSVSKVSPGVYDVTLNAAFANTGLCVTTGGHPSNSSATLGNFSVNAFVFGGNVVRMTTLLNSALTDFETVCLSINGDA